MDITSTQCFQSTITGKKGMCESVDVTAGVRLGIGLGGVLN